MYKLMTKAQFRKHMRRLTQIPEGFTGTFEDKPIAWGNETMLVYVVSNGDIEIVFDEHGNGHTNFNVEVDEMGMKHYRTFDLTGVEDSFYHYRPWAPEEEPEDLNALLREQLERVAEYYEGLKTAIPVPGIPFTVQPARLAYLQKRLQRDGNISFMPSGFGTGYTLSTKMHRGARFGSKELAQFFKVPTIFISTFDAD